MTRQDTDARIGRHWDQMTRTALPNRVRWWQSPLIRQHLNTLISGDPERGLLERAKMRKGTGAFHLGVSVGGGAGNKEMRILQSGLVESFEVFELSAERIAVGRRNAAKLGLDSRIRFRSDDAFEAYDKESVDFVHWDNSLHHMLDIDAAVAWSYSVLRPGGMFYMDDFVGPSRFQWSDESLSLANRLRGLFPDRYLSHPYRTNGGRLSRRTGRPDPLALIKQDPSEAAQSDKILSSVRKYFPDAEITLTGGIIYHLALNDILHNIDEDSPEDRLVLSLLLVIDELTTNIPDLQKDSHYAVALAIKSPPERWHTKYRARLRASLSLAISAAFSSSKGLFSSTANVVLRKLGGKGV